MALPVLERTRVVAYLFGRKRVGPCPPHLKGGDEVGDVGALLIIREHAAIRRRNAHKELAHELRSLALRSCS